MQAEEREQLESLLRLAESEDLAELTIRSEGETIRIRRGEDLLASFSRCVDSRDAVATGATPSAAPALPRPAETNPNLVHVTSPMVGVFYRSPSPGADAFVEIGTPVEEGQVVGLIEAMKVFNEIEAEVTGKVVALPAKNEQLVQHGDTLVVIERMDL